MCIRDSPRRCLPLKRLLWFSCFLCLALGLLVGTFLPVPWDQDPAPAASHAFAAAGSLQQGSGSSSSSPDPALDPNDNVLLFSTACAVNRALKERHYDVVASYVHPDRGVTFTPYSTVDFETDLNFNADQVRNLEQDETIYAWGITDGRGSLIEMTMSQYFSQYVYNTDYTQASMIGIDQIMISGNALENVSDAYPGCRFVDFSIPGLDAANGGMDWCSLRLVFEPGDIQWLLVGIIHGQWTI